MPLTNPQRLPLVKHVEAMRAPMPYPWDIAGIDPAVRKLEERYPSEPWKVSAETIRWASVPGATSPRILWDETLQAEFATAPAVIGTAEPAKAVEPPRVSDPECSVCGSQLRTPTGECVGCLQNAAAERGPRPVSPAAAPRRSGPPPPDVKAEMDRRQREFLVGVSRGRQEGSEGDG